jgi:hypothetical protein
MVPLAVKANTTAMTTRRVPWAVAPLDATASLTVQPILPLPPHTFSCWIKREQLPKLSVADSIAIARSTLRTCGASVGRPTMR